MTKKKMIFAAAASTVTAYCSTVVHAQALNNFTPGNIVVLVGSSESEDLGTVAASLAEYNLSGGLIGTIAIPSTAGSNPLTLDNAAISTHEGVLTESENGQYLTFGGYNLGAGATVFNSSAGITGTVGIIGQLASSLNTSTNVPIGGEALRSATTIDGNEFYIGEAHAANASLQGGINYVSGVGAGATTTILGPSTLDARSVFVVGGSNPSTAVLNVGDGSSSFNKTFGTIANTTNAGHGVYQITASAGGLPNASNTTLSGHQITGDSTDGSDLFYDVEPGNSNSYNGYNTLYVVGTNEDEGQIEKYTYNGTQFVPVNTVANSVYSYVESAGDNTVIGVTAQLDPVTGNMDVFYTESNGVYELTTPDNSTAGFSAAENSSSYGATPLISAPSDGAFYGVANAVPEPTALSLLGLGAGSLLGRRRRR
jgi:hypothetical protein